MLFVIASCALHLRAQVRAIDVQHYRFELGLTDSSDVITGAATVRFKANKKIDTVVLDLVDTGQGKGMVVSAVLLDGKPVNWTRSNDKLNILASPALMPAKETELLINFQGVPRDGLIISTNKFGDRTFFADNWPNRARFWLPCVDHPADKASVEFIVTAPMHYQVVSNGVQVEETIINDRQKLTHWKETTLLPTKIMVIGVAKFAVQYVGDTLGVPLYSWVYPQEKADAFYDYAQAKDILPFFINNIAPYAYRKLANVQSKTIFGGMENAGCIFYSEAVISGKRQAEDLIAHEIAHQWFGNMATEKSFAHLWLSEGFATYMTDLYMGSKHGAAAMNTRLKQERLQVIAFHKGTPRAVVDSATTNYMQLLNANSYQKGAWVLHMLRNELGHEVFMKGVRAYYNKYAGSNASTDDLRKVLEEISGRDLQVFFKQWLYTAGLPVLQVKHVYNSKKNELAITIVQQQAAAFEFPVDIEVQTAKGLVTKTFRINQKEHQYTIPNTGAVKAVVLDPGTKLLYMEAGQ